MFQMTFAIITPALIVGAYPERIRFGAVLLFSGLWLILVYAPVCHWVWGGGWLARLGVLDFAGGLVVHATAGTSAIVIARMLGSRQGFPARAQAAAQPVDDHDRRRHAVGRLVRLQRRQRAGGERQRRHGDAGDPYFGVGGGAHLDGHRMGQIRQAEPCRHRDGHGRRSGDDHAGLGLRRTGGRAGLWRAGGAGLLLAPCPM